MGVMNSSRVLSLLSVVSLCCLVLFCSAIDVTYDHRAIKIDGERKLLISGAIHYPRSTPDMWPSLIKNAKDGGLNTIETYVFWNAHEPVQRQYDFSGRLDLVRFIRTIQRENLYAILRIGPYVCAEWSYGGFPVWLHNLPDIKLRTNNEVYKREMRTFVDVIVKLMKKHNLFASQGGPIILAQIENEYGNVEWAYGDEGWQYVKWCKDLAVGYKLDIPWIMCQQDNAPAPMLSACNGFYCDQWKPHSNSTPKMWAENWTGWYKNWGGRDPHRTAEDLAFAVARFYQLGGSLQNYYMYHGGTNFGETAGGPYITTSYDYDAPLDEYGNLNQPKWGHLKDLHKVLKSWEKVLLYGDRVDHNNDEWGLNSVSVYSYRGRRLCFFSNAHKNEDFVLNFEGNTFTIPAWSTSILKGCYKEIYSTAKVNAQTSIMVQRDPHLKDSDESDERFPLEWKWTTEKVLSVNKNGLLGGEHLVSNQLLDQKTATNGTSDYLWVLTSVNYNKSDPIWAKSKIFLSVDTKGHILHAYVNGVRIGTQHAENGHYNFLFEKPVRNKILKAGKNQLSFLSTIVGLPNYGHHFDIEKVGPIGPIKLIARSSGGDVEQDVSSSQWVYQTGLHGMHLGIPHGVSRHVYWHVGRRPSNKELIWYKTTFPTPLGNDPVVVDFRGLGKGVAWVNGNHIGRYWPAYLASEDGCSIECDFRGTYNANKCNTNCGKSTQRWYHVPRDFLKDDGDNQLVLFEELGGSPELVNFKTMTVGKVCLHAYNKEKVSLSCQGQRVFSQIKFASFGLPEGGCGHFRQTECHARKTLRMIKKKCLGKKHCSFTVSEKTFGSLDCDSQDYRLAVEAVC